MIKNEKLQEAINFLLRKFPNIIAIYLFGSFDSKYERPDSDIDLAILLKENISKIDCFHLAQEIAKVVKKDVDLVDLATANSSIQFQIIHTGKRIYCQNKQIANNFEHKIFTQNLRNNELKAEILKDIKKRGSVYEH